MMNGSLSALRASRPMWPSCCRKYERADLMATLEGGEQRGHHHVVEWREQPKRRSCPIDSRSTLRRLEMSRARDADQAAQIREAACMTSRSIIVEIPPICGGK
jgi:hypothetical protein